MIKEILSVIIYSNKFVTAIHFYDKIYIKETKSVKQCQTKLCFLSLLSNHSWLWNKTFLFRLAVPAYSCGLSAAIECCLFCGIMLHVSCKICRDWADILWVSYYDYLRSHSWILFHFHSSRICRYILLIGFNRNPSAFMNSIHVAFFTTFNLNVHILDLGGGGLIQFKTINPHTV